MQKLESAFIANRGEVVENLPSLKVEVDGETFFESQDNQVIVNRRSLLELETVRRQAQIEEPDYSDNYDDYDYSAEQMNPDSYTKEPSRIEADEQQNEQVLADVLVEMMVPIIEAMPAIEIEPFQENIEEDIFFEEHLAQSQDKPSPDVETAKVSLEVATPQPTSVLLPQKTGLDAVQEALGDMKPGTLKSVLQGMAVDMQETLLSQPPTPALSHVAFTRLQDRQNPHWWDTLSTKISTTVTAVQETFAQHQAASTLKDFANRMALQPGDSFEGKDYNLSRQGNNYTLKDKEGNELLKFQSSPLGVKVDKSLPALDATHFSKTQQLRQDFKTGQQHNGAFVSQGAAEATNIERINTITQALTQYAAAQGGRAKVQGKFNYSFEASSSGSAIIRN
jgi:hypothetical protein